MTLPDHLKHIFLQFATHGELLEAVPYGHGHINDTYLGRYQTASGTAHFIHQRINHLVFKEPDKVMENIERVTRYAREQIMAAGGDPERETLTLVPTHTGCSYYQTSQGEYWRTYRHIDHARTYEVAQNLQQVRHAARAFGKFQKMLNNLPGPRLHETIPDFHHTRKRFDAFLQILQADPANRASQVKDEITFLLQREPMAGVITEHLANGTLPERITHNDTKLNNVMIDDQTGEGLCVIDLDTTMPGSVLYDFGDLVRMGTATAAEDEIDLSQVHVSLPLFHELANGYLEAAGDFLTPLERDLLVFAGRLITFEQAIRFLGDYLNGDTYYKIQRPEHNLDRARVQIKMISEMEQKQAEMEAVIQRCQVGQGSSIH
jgi:hypothetical protein